MQALLGRPFRVSSQIFRFAASNALRMLFALDNSEHQKGNQEQQQCELCEDNLPQQRQNQKQNLKRQWDKY
jgi:hypothetical protein